ncbi:DUF362 domain-containing protein [Candidatus Latescibacterota bacterium]
MNQSRREFFHHITAATAGVIAASYAKQGATQVLNSRTRVALTSGTDRRETVAKAIRPFKADIEKGIQGKRVFVKPNNVWDSNPLCATHPDAIRAVLDLLKEVTDQQIVVAESTASPKGTMFTFEEYGYLPLAKEYNIRFYDLNSSTSSTRWIHNRQLMPVNIEIIDEFLAPDIYWISMAMPKTHDSAIGTVGYKNMIMASPLNVLSTDPRFVSNQSEKRKMHGGGSLGFNWNMFEVAQHVHPDFVVVDGHEGMEGRGPVNGTAVEHNISLAGPDVVAVDRTTLELMGIAYEDVGYLQWCANAGIGQGNKDLIDIIGENPANHVIVYESHPNFERELEWKLGGTRASG